jgi:hypothetical protein
MSLWGALLIVLVLVTGAVRAGFRVDWPRSVITGMGVTMIVWIGIITWTFNHLPD